LTSLKKVNHCVCSSYGQYLLFVFSLYMCSFTMYLYQVTWIHEFQTLLQLKRKHLM